MEKKETIKIELPEGKFCGGDCTTCKYLKSGSFFYCDALGETVKPPKYDCPKYERA